MLRTLALQEDHGMEQTLIRSPHNMLVLRALDGRDHPLSDVTLVGREAECQLQLIEGHASRYHAKLTVTGPQQVLVEDLKSTNGTYVNGQRVETPIVASLGDELRFDTSRFRIATAHSGGANATVYRERENFARERDRETMAAAQSKPQPQPRPAPQVMTPAPQQPDIAPPPAKQPTPSPAQSAPAPAPTTFAPTMAPADDDFVEALSTEQIGTEQISAEPMKANPITTELPLEIASGLIIEHDDLDRIAAARAGDNNRTTSGAGPKPKKPLTDDGAINGRSKQKKVAHFQTQDQAPATGTSSLPADEMANLASKSSRTVRRMESTQGPRLIVLNPPARGMIFPLADSGSVGEWLIGRGEDADVALTDRTVSVRHAIVRKTGSRWEIENLNATNGVFVNGKLISRRIITTGDKVRLGRTEMQFRTDNDPGAEIAEATPSSSALTPGVLLALAGAVFVALFVLILILVLQRGP